MVMLQSMKFDISIDIKSSLMLVWCKNIKSLTGLRDEGERA